MFLIFNENDVKIIDLKFTCIYKYIKICIGKPIALLQLHTVAFLIPPNLQPFKTCLNKLSSDLTLKI